MTIYNKAISLIMLFSIASCTTKSSHNTPIGKSLENTIGVGFSGNSFGGIDIGSILEGVGDSTISEKLDKNDQHMIAQTIHNALEKAKTDSIIEWQNRDSGNEGLVKPTKTYQSSEGRYCREYIQEAKIGNESIKWYSTACRAGDGKWQIISSNV